MCRRVFENDICDIDLEKKIEIHVVVFISILIISREKQWILFRVELKERWAKQRRKSIT